MRAAVALAVLAACDGGSSKSLCERYVDHVGELSGFPIAPSERAATCGSVSDEQQRCGTHARTIEDLTLCMQFLDPDRRERARLLTPSVRATWPGAASLHDVLAGTPGCAFYGLLGAPDAPVEDLRVVAVFAVRDDQGSEDADQLFAHLERDDAGEPWRCVATDATHDCQELARRCHSK
jgi:hypothetical protein